MHNLFFNSLLANFKHKPTKNQQKVIGELVDFAFSTIKKHTFVLKGYAGTGKTSIIGALVKTLPEFNFTPVLLAPTGRAAKVLSNYSNQPAYTIHKMIYQLRSGGDGYTRFSIKENKFQNAIFLVDEASMIGDGAGLTSVSWGESKSLLDDLLSYVYSGINCKLILIGDVAQLPPVGMDVSPALDEDFLYQSYQLNLEFFELNEVVRQTKNSGILNLATSIRGKISNNNYQLPLLETNEKYKDVIKITGVELEDALSDAYSKYGEENCMVICRSNKRANIFNLQIRARIKWLEDEIASGDYLMVVKNNYFWLEDSSKAGFIANGDIVEILRIRGRKSCTVSVL